MMQPPSAVNEPVVVNLTPPAVQIAAGAEPIELLAYVRNASNTVDQYSIEVEGLDPSWYTITLQSVALFPGDSQPLPIRLHPPKGSQTRPGNYKFIVRARSQADPSIVGVTKGDITIGGYTQFQVELAPKRATGGHGNYKLNVVNTGNSDVQLEMSGRDPEASLKYSFNPPKPIVRAGARQTVAVRVGQTGVHAVGEQSTHRFVIGAKPVDGEEKDAKEVQGEFVHTPRWRSWKWPLVLMAALAAVLCLVLFRPNLNPCALDFPIFPAPNGVVAEGLYASWLCDNTDFRVGGPPPERQVKTDCQSGPGFAEVRQNYKDKVGECVENEWYDPNDTHISHQRTTTGRLMYINFGPGVKPQIYFFGDDKKIYAFDNCDKDTFKNCSIVEVSPAGLSTGATPTPKK